MIEKYKVHLESGAVLFVDVQDCTSGEEQATKALIYTDNGNNEDFNKFMHLGDLNLISIEYMEAVKDNGVPLEYALPVRDIARKGEFCSRFDYVHPSPLDKSSAKGFDSFKYLNDILQESYQDESINPGGTASE